MELITARLDNGIRIDQVSDPDAVVVIPEFIDNIPVVELGDYVLAHTDVEELHLPCGIVKIGAYAFYNCVRLKRLYCFSRIHDLGTGMFAGAKGAEFLDFVQIEGEISYLKDMLSELRQTLRVQIHGAQEMRLIFPEFYEEAVENTPARILSTDTHGCGHRYRYCFKRREFQYLDYDELFVHMQVQESEQLAAELAMGRLLYPCGLAPANEAGYRGYLREHWRTAGELIVETDCSRRARYNNLDRGLMPWFAEHYIDTEIQLQELVEIAQKAGDTEAVSWLMDFRHERFGHRGLVTAAEIPGKRRFEL